MARKNNPTINRLVKFLNKPKSWIVIIAAAAFLLRLPSLFEPHRYADEEIYLVLGQAFRKGLVFYRDIHDNKPPFLYLIAALAGNVFWFRFILFLWHGINLIIFWKLAKSLFEKAKPWLTGFTTLLFAIFTTIHSFEGNIANGENFMIMPATLGAYIIWKYRNNWKIRPFLIAGFLFAIAFLFKVPIIFDFAGIVLFLVFATKKSFKEKLKSLYSPSLWVLAIGFLLPIIISMVYYYFHGAFEPYFKAALFQNVGYLSSWEGAASQAKPPIWQGGLFQRGVVLLFAAGLIIAFYKKLSEAAKFAGFWFIFSLFGALLSGRPYPHYLLEPMAPAVLLLGSIFKEKTLSKFIIFLLLALLPISVYKYKFWHYKSLPYYKNFADFVFGKKGKNEYIGFFNGAVRNYQVADYVLKNTLAEDKIFVWGTEPAIYSISNRLPVGRYTVSYHIADFDAWEETIVKLNQEKPPIIVKMTNEPKSFPELDSFLDKNYILVKTINEAEIYQKLK